MCNCNRENCIHTQVALADNNADAIVAFTALMIFCLPAILVGCAIIHHMNQWRVVNY